MSMPALSDLSGAAVGEALLELSGVSVCFGGVFALHHVDLEVTEGALHGLIGPNGAGKTTLIDAVTGFEPFSEGRIRFRGRDIGGLPPHRVARAGITRTFQNLEMFRELTVEDNLRVSVTSGARRANLDEICDLIGIGDIRSRQVRELPHGVQRLVSIGRALANSPQLLILDEPAAGLDTDETTTLGQTLRSIVDSSVTILLVDHDMHLVMNICDSITVLSAGNNLASGAPEAISRDPDVRRVYLGESA